MNVKWLASKLWVVRRQMNCTTPIAVSKRFVSSTLSHVDQTGKATMVDISEKHATQRTAIAECAVKVTDEITRAIVENRNQKGDVFAVARIAGIQAAKITPNLIPLCHNIPLSVIIIDFRHDQEKNEIIIRSLAKTTASTGVEMEALTAVSVAALTVYDMCKAISHQIVITDIHLCGKYGGKREFGEKSL
ncbi:hypothetical protein AB6A40_005562 [Gnathostoma spinigerum]|uniref:cyclic pyranopterin monophosphate synthase n=1 Tax=Gnathostoma spinigerum TaxID=75299 RepID=A0ABD6EPD4_9BILA